jgi:hypothetical protein
MQDEDTSFADAFVSVLFVGVMLMFAALLAWIATCLGNMYNEEEDESWSYAPRRPPQQETISRSGNEHDQGSGSVFGLLSARSQLQRRSLRSPDPHAQLQPRPPASAPPWTLARGVNTGTRDSFPVRYGGITITSHSAKRRTSASLSG